MLYTATPRRFLEVVIPVYPEARSFAMTERGCFTLYRFPSVKAVKLFPVKRKDSTRERAEGRLVELIEHLMLLEKWKRKLNYTTECGDVKG
jgi:hypothetical protein